MPRPKKTTKAKESTPKKTTVALPTTLKGMKDILPYERTLWHFVEDTFNDIKKCYSFEEIETPIIENPNLYTGLYGKDLDNSESGVCVFGGKGKQRISLRPDARTSIARAVINHNLLEERSIIKLAYSGQLFTCEKEKTSLQYKRFYELGCEVIGEQSAAIDAHLIMVGYTILKTLGLSVMININSIGDTECRDLYKEAVADYFKQYKTKLDVEQKKWLRKEPTRLLTLKGKKYQEMVEGAPQIVDYLSDDCKAHFFAVLEYLDDFDIPYNLDPSLMKDFNYYNRTVFEFYPVKDGVLGEAPYGGGGRYDYVIEKLSGNQVPASGVSFDVETLVAQMKFQDVALPETKPAQLFVAQIGEQARRQAMVLFEALRAEGFDVMEGFVYNSLKSQLEIVNRLRVPYVLILGQKEVVDGTILFRDMEGGIQEIIDLKKVVAEMKKRITKE